MGNTRKTVYNNICSPEKLAQVNPENIQLGNDFLEYLTSIDRAKTTIESYRYDLDVIWVLILELLNNIVWKGLAAFAVGSFYLKRKDVNKWEIQEKLYITTFALLRS